MGDATCAIHGKVRNVRYLKDTGGGRFACTAENECKAAGAGADNDLRAQCTLHGKLRSLDCLQDDGTGKLVCTRERGCKAAGRPMDDQREHSSPLVHGDPCGHMMQFGGCLPMAYGAGPPMGYGAAHFPGYPGYGMCPPFGMWPGMPGMPSMMPGMMPGMPGVPGMIGGMPGMHGIPDTGSLLPELIDKKDADTRSLSQQQAVVRSEGCSEKRENAPEDKKVSRRKASRSRSGRRRRQKPPSPSSSSS